MNKSKYDFSGQLNAGTAVLSQMASWWPRHAGCCLRYITARVSRDETGARAAADLLSDLAGEWHKAVPSTARPRAAMSGGLMGDHAALEMSLVDASVSGDEGAIERAGIRLQENALTQREKYTETIPGFPTERFRALMKDHMALLVETIRCGIGGDAVGLKACAKLRDRNTAALAAFATEWF